MPCPRPTEGCQDRGEPGDEVDGGSELADAGCWLAVLSAAAAVTLAAVAVRPLRKLRREVPVALDGSTAWALGVGRWALGPSSRQSLLIVSLSSWMDVCHFHRLKSISVTVIGSPNERLDPSYHVVAVLSIGFTSYFQKYFKSI